MQIVTETNILHVVNSLRGSSASECDSESILFLEVTSNILLFFDFMFKKAVF